MRILLPSSFLFVVALSAQDAPTAPADPLIAAGARVTAALQKCATLTDTAFTALWGPDGKQQDDGQVAFLIGGTAASGEASGSWHRDRLHLAFAGETADELVLAGRCTIAKDSGNDWRRRTARFADGNDIGFVPDVPQLLQQLASYKLPIIQRTTGSVDDRPVEIVSITLTAEQVAEAVWTGVLPGSLVTPMGGAFAIRMGGVQAGGKRPAATAPDGIIDLAIFLDPATGLVHRLQFRAWVKQDARFGNVRIMRAGAAGAAVQVVNGGAAATADDEDDKDEPAADAPLVYENGLPKRPRKKMAVSDYSVQLQQHGKRVAPELSDRQKQLLGY